MASRAPRVTAGTGPQCGRRAELGTPALGLPSSHGIAPPPAMTPQQPRWDREDSAPLREELGGKVLGTVPCSSGTGTENKGRKGAPLLHLAVSASPFLPALRAPLPASSLPLQPSYCCRAFPSPDLSGGPAPLQPGRGGVSSANISGAGGSARSSGFSKTTHSWAALGGTPRLCFPVQSVLSRMSWRLPCLCPRRFPTPDLSFPSVLWTGMWIWRQEHREWVLLYHWASSLSPTRQQT